METKDNPELQKLRQWGYDDIADEIAHGIQRWDNGLKRRRALIPERYLNGKCGVHLHVLARIDGQASVSKQYCIDFERVKIGGNGLGVEDAANVLITPLDEANRTLANTVRIRGEQDAADRREYAVFVDNVELMDLPDGIGCVVAPSEVRLHPLDGGRCRWMEAANHFCLITLGHGSIEDGEFGSLDLLCGHTPGMGESQREGQVVESGPKVKNTIADEDAKSQGHLVNPRHANPFPDHGTVAFDDMIRRWIRVWFVDNSLGLIFHPHLGLSFEKLDMFIRPVELEPEAVGRTHIAADNL